METENLKCTSCDKSFTESHSLQIHIKSIEKDFKCGLCCKSYMQLMQIKNHIKKFHDGEYRKPEDDPQLIDLIDEEDIIIVKKEKVDKPFSNSYNLEKHTKSMHRQKIFNKLVQKMEQNSDLICSSEENTHIPKVENDMQGIQNIDIKIEPLEEEVDDYKRRANLFNISQPFTLTSTPDDLKLKHDIDSFEKMDIRSTPKFKSVVWKHFKRNKRGDAKCNQCDKILEHKSGSSTCFLRGHLKKHGIKFEKNPVWKHFKRRNNIYGPDHLHNETILHVECNYCKNYIKVNTRIMKAHLIFEHGIHDLNNSIKKISTAVENSNFIDVSSSPQFKSFVWKYFKRNVQGTAKCNQCGKIIETKRGCTGSLRSHLRTHGIFDDNSKTQNLYQNNVKDEFDDTYYESCRYCGWSGANSQLLLEMHIKNLHEDDTNLNKTFEAEVKARLVEPLDC